MGGINQAEVVNCRGRDYVLRPELYWHLSARNALLLNNVFLAEGLCHSISQMNEMPGLERAVSPYGLKAQNDGKEQIWEAMRRKVDPRLPSRIGAVFLVGSEDWANRLNELWFPNERRLVLEARVIEGSEVHYGDARWLESPPEAWEANATLYWGGKLTKDILPETLVHGLVYFPGWRKAPFGVGAGIAPS